MDANLETMIAKLQSHGRQTGFEIDHVLAAYLAILLETEGKLTIESSNDAINTENSQDDDSIGTLATAVLQKLADKDNALFYTAKMQVAFRAAEHLQYQLLDKERRDQTERVDMSCRAVTGSRPIKDSTAQSYMQFYKLLMEYVAAKSGLEKGLVDETARQELQSAMESVFPLSQLARYFTLTEEERASQVEELARITKGICLFNSSSGRGGHVLPMTFTAMLPSALHLKQRLDAWLQSCLADIRKFEMVIAAEVVGPQQRQQLHEELVFRNQERVYLQDLLEELAGSTHAAEQLQQHMQQTLQQVQALVGSNKAVNKDLVFPLFDNLASLHSLLLDELRLLVVRERLAEVLQQAVKGFTGILAQNPRKLGLVSSVRASSSESWEFLKELPEALQHEDFPHPNPEERTEPLQLAGCCPVTLAEKGLLVTARPEMGVIRKALGYKL